MKRYALLAAAGALLISSVPSMVLAGQEDFPTGCAASAKPDKQAVRVWNLPDFNGPKEVECGTHWADNDGQRVMDGFFADKPRVDPGAIENFNDITHSMILYNRSNKGACFTFYWDHDYNGGFFDQRISFWVWGTVYNTEKVRWTKVRDIPGAQISSMQDYRVGAPGYSTHDTAAECKADSYYIGHDYPATEMGVTY